MDAIDNIYQASLVTNQDIEMGKGCTNAWFNMAQSPVSADLRWGAIAQARPSPPLAHRGGVWEYVHGPLAHRGPMLFFLCHRRSPHFMNI